MEMRCQSSYPLNSENASPLGTFTSYLAASGDSALAQAYATASVPIISPRSILMPPPITSESNCLTQSQDDCSNGY